ncbi:MAG: hypothetical protein P1V34_09830 [Alphaproteobacteria bacterium]|nr:hypothetical protein [Alphaproteobacteria bacterium]
MISVHPLSHTPIFKISQELVISPEDMALSDRIWNQLLMEFPHLKKGSILIAKKVDPPIFHVAEAPYQLFAAARRDAELANRLKIQPIAVSGILMCQDGLVLGKRANWVTQYPGFWEMVPSGGVTLQPNGNVDIERQIQDELWEEIGISNANIGAPLGWVYDTESGVIDFVMPISTQLRMSELQKLTRSDEYSDIKVVQNIATFLDQTHNILPVTRFIAQIFILKKSKSTNCLQTSKTVK